MSCIKSRFYSLQKFLSLKLNIHPKNQIQISGHFEELKTDSLTFIYTVGAKTHHDKVAVRDGEFRWSAKMVEPQIVHIEFPLSDGYYSYPFFAEAGQMHFFGSGKNHDSLLQIKIIGSPAQALFNSYTRDRLFIMKKIRVLEELMAENNADNSERVNLQLIQTEKMLDTGLREKYILNNSENYVSLYLLGQLIDNMIDYHSANILFQSLTKSLRLSPNGIALEIKLGRMFGSSIQQYTQRRI